PRPAVPPDRADARRRRDRPLRRVRHHADRHGRRVQPRGPRVRRRTGGRAPGRRPELAGEAPPHHPLPLLTRRKRVEPWRRGWHPGRAPTPEVPDVLRHHEIAEADHRILNPFTEEKLRLLGEVSRIGPGARILDLACGKGEMLCRWAADFGSAGHGVDLSEWLRANPGDPDAPAMREFAAASRRSYLAYNRRYLGWG